MTRRPPALARRLVEPTWLTHPVYVETYGPEVAELNAASGVEPDPTQELLLDLTFAINRQALPVAFEVAGVGPRQNFKTAFIRMAEIGWLYVTEERLIVHSAHELDTTEDSFSELRNQIEGTPSLSRWLDPSVGRDPGITSGNGKWTIQLVDGRKVKFKARTKTGGRGLTGSKTVLDEAFAVTPSMVGSLYPTMVTRPTAQVLAMSSACLQDSTYLRTLRDRGRKGDKRLVYLEHGDPTPAACDQTDCLHGVGTPGCRADDEEAWSDIMPAITYGRIDLDLLRDMRRAMPPAEWCREFMVWHDDPPNASGSAIGLDDWSTLLNAGAKQPRSAVVVLTVSADRSRSTIGVASRGGKKNRTMVMQLTGPGTEWVVPRLERMMAKRDLLEVALAPATQAAVLIPELNAAGIEFYKLTPADEAQACGRFLRDVKAEKQKLEHVGQPELDAAVKAAGTKKTGDKEMWESTDPTIDISPLRAVSAAAYRWKLMQAMNPMDNIW